MDDVRALKKQLRREIKVRSAALTDAYREDADRKIRDALLHSEIWRKAENVFLYVSMWAEPDTRALIEAALTEGKRVYVPLCCPDRVMKAARLRGLDELRPGTLGIPEPPSDAETAAPGEPDLAVVPCVTVTAAGARLGHGAGYYDRFLSRHACTALCLCYERLLSNAVPVGEYDVRMDLVLTEAGFTDMP